MCETEGRRGVTAVVGRSARKTGGFLAAAAGRPVAARIRQKTRCGSRRQSGGAHFVDEFLRAARVQLAPQQLTDLGRLGVELLDQAAQVVAVACQSSNAGNA